MNQRQTIDRVARAIYEARFADEPKRCVTHYDDLPAEMIAIWHRCARASLAPGSAGAPLAEPPGVLCFVKDGFAFFTTAPLDEQWGDDWNDAPYEHNAGAPYREPGVILTCIPFVHGSLSEPCADILNSRWSVEAINRGETPWLSTLTREQAPIRIMAGASFAAFQAALLLAGGTALAPWPSPDMPARAETGSPPAGEAAP